MLKSFSYLAMAGWTFVRLGFALQDLSRRGAVRRRPGDILLFLGLLALATKIWGVELFKVSSSSMEPTLNPGEVFLAVKRPLWRGPVQVGQIVVLHRDGVRISELVKRVGAVAGDSLAITGKDILVNNKVAWRSSVSDTGLDGEQMPPLKMTVPDRAVFVLGDNLPNSVDSRYFGPVSEGQVYGKALLRVYPLNRWGWL